MHEGSRRSARPVVAVNMHVNREYNATDTMHPPECGVQPTIVSTTTRYIHDVTTRKIYGPTSQSILISSAPLFEVVL
jgi:hypothetical protein